jgi:hypothetical protein
MNTPPPNQTVKEVMQAFFKKYNLGEDGGINKTWAKIKVGPIYLPLLNIPARRKVLVFHDIHHIVTGYTGDWRGETSISAWEIASGCGKYWVAWVLDIGAIAIGLFIYPKSVYRAFIRGLRTKNLYHDKISRETALDMQVKKLQEELLLAQYKESPASIRENLIFTRYAIIALLWMIIPILLLVVFLNFLIK